MTIDAAIAFDGRTVESSRIFPAGARGEQIARVFAASATFDSVFLIFTSAAARSVTQKPTARTKSGLRHICL
jgi:hypothetical protein